LLQKVQQKIPEETKPEDRQPKPDSEQPEDAENPADGPQDVEPAPGEPAPKGRRPGLPRAARGQKKEVEVPPAAAAMIKPRRGYANYYFNELNRDRVWKAFVGS